MEQATLCAQPTIILSWAWAASAAARPTGWHATPGPTCWALSSLNWATRGAAPRIIRGIIRLSYHTPGYVELAKLAYAAWHTVEEDDVDGKGTPLIVRTGGLDLAPAGAAIDLNDYVTSLGVAGVDHELLDAAEIMQRWPQFTLTDDVRGLYQAQSGIAPAAKCNAAHQRLARAHGATLLARTPILDIQRNGGEIEVITAEHVFRCGYLVIAGGAWSNSHLRRFGRQLPLTVTQEQVTYFNTPHLADFAPDRFPVWIWMDEPSYYGFPVYGAPVTKVAQDVGGREVTATTRTFEPDAAAADRVAAFTRRILPQAVGPVLEQKTCLYTLTPDRDFVIDTLPEQPNVAVAVGAGHAFKFASVIGQLLAGLVGAPAPAVDLTPFAVDRAILLEENPVKTFMV